MKASGDEWMPMKVVLLGQKDFDFRFECKLELFC